MIKKIFNILIGAICLLIFFPVWVILFPIKKVLKPRGENQPRLVWGPVPVISNSYWSNALKVAGYHSITLMDYYYAFMHEKSIFDKYTYELLPLLGKIKTGLFRKLYSLFLPYISFTYAVSRYDIFHHHFSGGFLGKTPFWKLEAGLLKLAGCKNVITAYGADFYRYSQIMDISWRNALLKNPYTNDEKREKAITKKVNYWVEHADAIITGFHVDGIGRWDVLPFTMFTISSKSWEAKTDYSKNNGSDGAVKIIHTPNHRGPKGSEFVLHAIEELKAEGLKIELILLERIPNEMVKEKMKEADILVEQLIRSYAMSAIEGMVSGLPVLSNLDFEDYTRVFRRYSYLNECPILSTSPESIKENLSVLITNPRLREELGKAGRQYVEKYHSDETAQYMYGKIYEKIWFKKDVDLMNLFHPILSAYNKSKPYVQHPLVENKLPKDYSL